MINPIIMDYLKKKNESIQYKAALAKTSTSRGTSREKLYLELVLESSLFV